MNSPMPMVLQQDAEAWALRINARWRQSIENYFETGDLLINAKEMLPHGEFETMVETRLMFHSSTARRLMIIAKDKRLRAHVHVLPPSWGTIYELSKLSNEDLDRGIEAKIIHTEMERKDVDMLRPALPRPSIQEFPEPAESDDPDQNAAAKVAEQSGEQEAGEMTKVGASAPSSPALLAPADPAAVEGASEDARSHAPPASPSMPSGGLAIAHRRVEAADSLDFFPTPPWATRALFERVLAHLGRTGHCQFQTAWEPCCGEGHMSETMKEYFREVHASDKGVYPAYANQYDVADFLDPLTVGADKVDWIITNPPFNFSADIVLKALRLAGTGVAMFVRLAWLESVGRYEKIFRDHPPTVLSIFTERVPLHKGRWEEDGTTMTAYIWLVWIKGAEPQAPFWIPPGCRDQLSKPEDVKRFGRAAVEGSAVFDAAEIPAFLPSRSPSAEAAE